MSKLHIKPAFAAKPTFSEMPLFFAEESGKPSAPFFDGRFCNVVSGHTFVAILSLFSPQPVTCVGRKGYASGELPAYTAAPAF